MDSSKSLIIICISLKPQVMQAGSLSVQIPMKQSRDALCHPFQQEMGHGARTKCRSSAAGCRLLRATQLRQCAF